MCPAVGICNGLPKLVVHRPLLPVSTEPHLRLLCHEGDLALHRLDVALPDRPASNNPNIRLYNHAPGSSTLAWYGMAAMVEAVCKDYRPHCRPKVKHLSNCFVGDISPSI